jgi:hypothetical protein
MPAGAPNATPNDGEHCIEPHSETVRHVFARSGGRRRHHRRAVRRRRGFFRAPAPSGEPWTPRLRNGTLRSCHGPPMGASRTTGPAARYRFCRRAPPPWCPATPPGRQPAGAGGTYRWIHPVTKTRLRLGSLRGDGNCSCSRHGRAESSPWSTQSSVLQGDSVCAVGRVGCALAPGAVSLVGGVRGRVDCQVCCTSGRSSLWPFRR